MASLTTINRDIVGCNRCARLRQHCEKIASQRKREFRDWEYWGKPVPSFGDPGAKVWIVGLAPAAHGANRTGRMFTGDSSGNWLFRALYRHGFANQETAISREDGLILKGVYISASAHCAPPDNKPTPGEIANCAPFLDAEYPLLKKAWLMLALGKIGFDTTCRLLERHGETLGKPRPKFSHGAFFDFGGKSDLMLLSPQSTKHADR